MKGAVLLLLAGVAGLAIWKHHHHASSAKVPTSDVPSGVSQYSTTPAPNRPDQVIASQLTNEDAVSEPGFAGAFGAYENQPGDGESLY